MKRIILAVVVSVALTAVMTGAVENPEPTKSGDCFFLAGLHSTARGMSYWYSKEQGG